jgi:4-hydroxy-tetrahydrodipicolinate synthase
MTARMPWTGCGTALITPFTSRGTIDEAALRMLTRRQIDAGVHFLVPCGTTGETPTLSRQERRRVVEIVAEESAGEMPILAGAGGYHTEEVCELADDMANAGATGLLSVTPYYNKPTQEGLFQHFSAIAAHTPLPIVLYNVPGRTGCNLEPATVRRLADVPGIVGVKEASGNMFQMAEICRIVPETFSVLSGDDALTLPLMAVGGRGVISVASNEVPADMAALVEAAEHGDMVRARQLHARLLPLMQVNFVESNPIPVKAALAMMGLIEEQYRLPMVPPSEGARSKIMQVLLGLGLLEAGHGERQTVHASAQEHAA